MTHDPLTNPQVGDSVVARVGNQYVTRTVRTIHPSTDELWVDDSRWVCRVLTSKAAWRRWCKKYGAKVVREEAK